MAAPLVSTTMLLMRSVGPDLKPQEVRDIVGTTARPSPFGCHSGDSACEVGGCQCRGDRTAQT